MPMPMHYPSQSPHLEVALLSEKKQRRDEESQEPGANHGDVGLPINPTKKPHPVNTKQGSGSTAARPSNISNVHSPTSTRPAHRCNTRQGRAQVNRSQVFHRRKICTLATLLVSPVSSEAAGTVIRLRKSLSEHYYTSPLPPRRCE